MDDPIKVLFVYLFIYNWQLEIFFLRKCTWQQSTRRNSQGKTSLLNAAFDGWRIAVLQCAHKLWPNDKRWWEAQFSRLFPLNLTGMGASWSFSSGFFILLSCLLTIKVKKTYNLKKMAFLDLIIWPLWRKRAGWCHLLRPFEIRYCNWEKPLITHLL